MFHARDIESTLREVKSSDKGLPMAEVEARLNENGANVLISRPPHSPLKIFINQFMNPLIFILCGAAIVSYLIGDLKDTVFIILVILVNALIGASQEYSAEKSAEALKNLSTSKAKVIRDGDYQEVDSENLVVGDIVILESGDRVPADLRLIETKNFEVDESLLTGESLTVHKKPDARLEPETSIGDRINMAFTGSTVAKGRAMGIVIGTGYNTELGKIADTLSTGEAAKPPLLIRMEDFTRKIAITLSSVMVVIAIYLFWQGNSWNEVFIFCVALIVASIPEGLPISMTVALSVASRKMAKKNVIVRKLPAVEALGSCTYIATDKTGTLTVNQLTVSQIAFPDEEMVHVTGSGLDPLGEISENHENLLHPLVVAGVLCNEGSLKENHDGNWKGLGDAVDLAFLSLAHKARLSPADIRKEYKQLAAIPYESENQYAASMHENNIGTIISVKGALEKILPLCDSMVTRTGDVKLNREKIFKQADYLADHGFKVIVLANKKFVDKDADLMSEMGELTLIGLVGLLDPLRGEARDSITKCRSAGIKVAMVTGDHPRTSLAIARELHLADNIDEVVSGPQLKSASEEERQELIRRSKVFARVDPQQKYEIVDALNKQNEFTAVTGDGANDAPALNTANVGIAMGRSGTDVAKETADLIITDDRFATIVAGIEEGRIAYSNIRKVVYLLISTGMAELLIFIFSIMFNTPMPLTAVQILWLNLVTNGIQDKGLAFEPGDGDELRQAPRNPSESIFDRLMIERVVISALYMGGVSFLYFTYLIKQGVSVPEARNLVLLLVVLFENFMIGNCRSEKKSAFLMNPFKNPILLMAVLTSQAIHLAAMYIPGLQATLGTAPVTLNQWLVLLGIASSIVVVMELFKFLRRFLAGSKTSP